MANPETEYFRCPMCGYHFQGEDLQGYVTYWGEDAPVDDVCPNCDVMLIVTECVHRTWDVEVKGESDA